MRSKITTFGGAAIWLAMSAAAFASDEPQSACTKTTLGAGVTLSEATPVAAILAKPDEYAGKKARVEGEVKAVCAARGCWLELAADGGETFRVEVEDGVIVFPMRSKGRRAVAEGVVESVELTRDEYVASKTHAAHEGGAPFDESKVGDGPFRAVHLKGTGAEVCVD